jgi:Protein of unknown function (DUF2752).
MLTRWHSLKRFAQRNPKLAWGSLIGAGGLLYLKAWLPLTNLGIPCVFHEVTGLYCPGCGMTRAALSAFELDFEQALRFNVLPAVLIPLGIAYAWANRKKRKRASYVLIGAMLALTLLFGVLRNIPPFDWLAPTVIG